MEFTGNVELLKMSKLAIIGSRKASLFEEDTAKKAAKAYASEGKVIVSGLAIGIDTAAMRAAVEANGKVIAVLSTSKEEPIYPKENNQLAHDIVSSGGLLIHCFPANTERNSTLFKSRLVERDYILAAISDIIIAVSDSPVITGGTRHAIHGGIKYKKEVYQLGSSYQLRHPQVSGVYTGCYEFDLSTLLNIIKSVTG